MGAQDYILTKIIIGVLLFFVGFLLLFLFCCFWFVCFFCGFFFVVFLWGLFVGVVFFVFFGFQWGFLHPSVL